MEFSGHIVRMIWPERDDSINTSRVISHVLLWPAEEAVLKVPNDQ